MASRDIAIKVENLSKIYRIGLKEEIHDSFLGALTDFLKSPFKKYRTYRSLYNFDDLSPDSDPGAQAIIWALKDVSFEVKKGEALGIIGKNGAGKSTLLKILSRITGPTDGEAVIYGKVSSLLEVGTGFHQELTGRENVYLNGSILGMKKKEIDGKFDEIVDFSGIEKFIDTPVKRYSSGMKVRLAFSVAAHLEPDILIIDEVLAVGDADFQKKCLKKMEHVEKGGRTVLFVSHNLPAVNRLCQRTILLDEGRLVQDGPSPKVVNSYLNSSSGTTASIEWESFETAPAGYGGRLRALRVLSKDGEINESIDIRRKFQIEMEYEVLKSGYILLPHFHLINEYGQIIFVTVDQDPAWRGRRRPAGHYISTVWIPGNLLAEGLIFVSCYLITLNPDTVVFRAENAVSFNIIDSLEGNSARGDYVKTLPGVVRPLLHWETKYTPAGYSAESSRSHTSVK
jgi:lipopolysaccharide transport system ATP-binding protein